jgi:ankyrin repeat protein
LKNAPLHIAAKFGHFLIVKYLIENGATSTLLNKDGETPFDMS